MSSANEGSAMPIQRHLHRSMEEEKTKRLEDTLSSPVDDVENFVRDKSEHGERTVIGGRGKETYSTLLGAKRHSIGIEWDVRCEDAECRTS